MISVADLRASAARGPTLETFVHCELREQLAALAGSKFHRGVVLSGGTEVIPFGENLHAVPASWLWS